MKFASVLSLFALSAVYAAPSPHDKDVDSEELPIEKIPDLHSTGVCNPAITNARCVGTKFQLCGVRKPGSDLYYWGPIQDCGPGTVCTPNVVNGVSSVYCGFPIGPAVIPAVQTCNPLKRNARCIGATGFQLCGARQPGSDLYYWAVTQSCAPGTVCKYTNVNGVSSIICDYA